MIYHTVNSLRSYLHHVNIVIVSIGHCVIMIMSTLEIDERIFFEEQIRIRILFVDQEIFKSKSEYYLELMWDLQVCFAHKKCSGI